MKCVFVGSLKEDSGYIVEVLLFLLFINQLGNLFSCCLLLFLAFCNLFFPDLTGYYQARIQRNIEVLEQEIAAEKAQIQELDEQIAAYQVQITQTSERMP